MLQLDRRTRTEEDVEWLTPTVFFDERFPILAATNGRLVADAIDELDAPPLAIQVDGDSWSIVRDGPTVAVVPGVVTRSLVVSFTAKEFSDWCQNERSFNSYVVARTLQWQGGTERDISIWDSLWMSLLYGLPTVGQVDFVDRDGARLDLDRCFTPDDDPADVAHFLREAGFLHLRGWTDPALMPLISADMDRVLPSYVEGDGKSWWAQLRDGTRVCVRLQEFVQHSPATVEMLSSERWDLLRRTVAADETLVQGPVEGRCIEALIKPVGVANGPSDLTFHRDCHLGRHAHTCAGTVIGVSLTASDPSNGQLRIIPGSHRIWMPVEIAKTEPFMPAHPLTTEPGDLTMHMSCTLHEATAPISQERRVMYANFGLAHGKGQRSPGNKDLAELREQVTNLLRDDAAT